jgi:U3 small nucleolar RNA-associated protein 25
VLELPRKNREYVHCNGLIRLAKQMHSEEVSEPESESSEEEEAASEDESSDDEDEEEVPAVRPYAALIQSLAAESGPRAKRRKLDHTHQSEDKLNESKLEDPTLEEEDSKDRDDVEEAEEGPETATDDFQDEEELEDASDPFESHFADPDNNLLSQRLKSLQQTQWDTKKIALSIGGKAVISVPKSNDSEALNALASISGPEELKLKQRLSGAAIKQRPIFNKLEGSVAPFIFNYRDILFCDRHPANAESLRRLTCLHAVNHIFKSVPSL